MIASWDEIIKHEMAKPYFKDMDAFLKARAKTHTIFPPKEDIFNAFKLCPIDKLKAIIIAQDPYHGPGQAHGLAFSVKEGVSIPPSLRNIYKELSNDIGCAIPKHGCLNKWGEQGVLLLNTYLSVEANKPGSHKNIGWIDFTKTIIETVNTIDMPIVYILWGAHAKSIEKSISNKKHLVIFSDHPSPLSANRGNFFGGKYFSRTNSFLIDNGIEPISWKLD